MSFPRWLNSIKNFTILKVSAFEVRETSAKRKCRPTPYSSPEGAVKNFLVFYRACKAAVGVADERPYQYASGINAGEILLPHFLNLTFLQFHVFALNAAIGL